MATMVLIVRVVMKLIQRNTHQAGYIKNTLDKVG